MTPLVCALMKPLFASKNSWFWCARRVLPCSACSLRESLQVTLQEAYRSAYRFAYRPAYRSRTIGHESLVTLLYENCLRLSSSFQRTPAKGGKKRRGGGDKASRGEPPYGKQLPTPLTSVRSAPPPYSISLKKSVRNSQSSPQLTTSETAFGGSQKWLPTSHPREVLLFGTFCSPPWLCPEFDGSCLHTLCGICD